MSNDDVIDCLNTLIDTCKDGEYGFRTCAEHTTSAQLKQVFSSRAEECQRGASELQAAVRRLGGDPDHGSSTTGKLHRGWVDLKGMLTGNDDQAADIAQLVQRQYEGVKRNHDQIRSLRDRMRSTAS